MIYCLVLCVATGSSAIKKYSANFLDLGFVPTTELLYSAAEYAHGYFSVR